MGSTRSARRAIVVTAVLALALVVPAPSSNALTVFKVTNTNDSGDGSLRRAINDARNDPGIDAIFFKIPGPGVHTIQPLTDLPDVHDNIAGDSQPGYSGTPLIQLDGSMDAETFPVGLVVERGIVFGLDIVRFHYGLVVGGLGTILANVVGADPGGTVAMPNTKDGIVVIGQGAVIGDGDGNGHGNVISGNSDLGIDLVLASDTTIEGNLIGTNASGNQALPNGLGGIWVECDGQDNVIGGLGGARNVVSGNAGAAIVVIGDEEGCGTPNRTVVQGDLIGLDAGGTFPIPNDGAGVIVSTARNTHVGTWPSTGNVISGNHGPGVLVAGVTVGATTVDSNLIGVNTSGGETVPNAGSGVLIRHSASTRVGQRVAADHQGDPNVISGNQGDGIRIVDSDMTNVFGNLIGVGSNGALPASNQGVGVGISGGADIHVGGGLVGQGNVISSNTGDGVQVRGDDASGTPAVRVSIQGNWIGTNRAVEVSDGNGGSGISILPNADGTRIGNVVGVEGPNVIAHNSGDGVTLAGSVGVRIRGNAVFENAQVGFRMFPGANHGQSPPVLTNVKLANGQLTIKGTLQSHPSQDYAIELFGNAVCDPSGAGEGETFLGNDRLTTDASGFGSFTFKVPFNVSAAPVVTATATRSKTGDTSLFSVCK